MKESLKNSYFRLFCTLILSIICFFIIWIISFSKNGHSSILYNSAILGININEEKMIPLEANEQYVFNFVAYEDISNLSIYIDPNNSKGTFVAKLYNERWELLEEATVEISKIKEKGFFQLFDTILVENPSRQIFILSLNDFIYSDENNLKVFQEFSGKTALYSTSKNKMAVKYFIFIAIILSFIIAISYVMAGKNKIHMLFLIISVPTIALYSLLLYPGTACDEPQHFMCSYRISNTWLGIEDETYDTWMRQTDADLLKDRWAVPTIEGMHISFQNFLHRTSNTELVQVDYYAHDTDGLTHMPSALGITLGRLLKFNSFTTYYLGRFSNAALYFILGVLSLYIAKGCKDILFIFLMNPLVVNLCCSVNQDGAILPIAFVMIAYWSYCNDIMREQNRNLSIKEWIIFVILEVLLLNCKVYGIIGLLFITLPHKFNKKLKIDRKKRILVSFLMIAVLVVVGYIFFKFNKYGGFIIELFAPIAPSGQYTLGYMVSHLGQTIKIFFDTVLVEGIDWFISAFGYRVSWETYLSPLYSVAFIILLIVSALDSTDKNSMPDKYQRSMMMLILTVLFAAVIIRAYSWTYVGAALIYGVQGRYFIPVLPLLFIAIKNNVVKTKKLKKYIPLFTVVIFACHAVNLYRVLF